MTGRRTPVLLGAAAVAALALAACGSSSSSTTSSTSSSPASTPASPAGAGGYATPSTAATTGGRRRQAQRRPDRPAQVQRLDPLHARAGAVTLQMLDPSGCGSPHGISVQGNGVDKDSAVVQGAGPPA